MRASAFILATGRSFSGRGNLLLALIFCSALCAHSQYQVDVWTTDSGLPQNIMVDLCQTPNGYLWLATLDGLVRFDGVRFTVFNRSNTAGILGNRFASLYCGPSGEIWASAESIGVTRYRNGDFETYTTKQGLPSNGTSAVTGDDKGHIWALSHGTIVRWSEARSQFVSEDAVQARLKYSSDGSAAFWAADQRNLYVFARGTFVTYNLPQGSAWQKTVIVGHDPNGVIWMADDRGRLISMHDGRWSHARRVALNREASFDSTYRDSRGHPWQMKMAFKPGGHLLQSLLVDFGAHPRNIEFNAVLQDREGSIWLATDGEGLYRIRRKSVTMFSKQDGLPDENVYPIYQDRSGVIWIGTWNGGLARLSNGRVRTFLSADSLGSNRITSISEDQKGFLWVATYGGLFRGKQGRFELENNPLLQPGKAVQAIHEDKAGTLWLGTDRGLIRKSGATWSLLTVKDGLATDDVRTIVDGRAGNLWIGGYGGLSRLKSGHFERWTEADGLPSNSIRSLYEDDDGVLWIGTYDGGLGRLEDGKLTRFTVRDGLFNNGVFQLLEDARGYLWMSSNRGIYRVLKSELTQFAHGSRASISSINYDKQDGMLNSECNGGYSPAGVRTRDGRLWFPTQQGAAIIDPSVVETNSQAPPVVIQSLSIDHEGRPVAGAIRVLPGQEFIDIAYTAPSLIDSDHIQFKYTLGGLDQAWVNASTRRIAYYSHLPPGEYNFHVIAANSDGVWNTTGAQLHISVLPRFYQTWWFLAIWSLATLGTLYLIWHGKISQLEKKRALQQEISRQLLLSQESERKRIAAELHDSLGQHLLIIKNWAALALRGNPDAASENEPLVQISETASQAIDEVREITYNLRPFQLEKLGLSTAIRDLVDQVAGSSNIRFSVSIDDLDGAFPKEAEISVYRMVQEALNNIVRHSHATEAGVSLRREAILVKITIWDDGHGFLPPETTVSQSGPSGFGLLGISERVRTLRGQESIESSPGAGTVIRISLRSEEGGS